MSGIISSRSNQTVKELAALKQRRNRIAAGRYLIEGTREITMALAGGRVVVSQIVACPDLAGLETIGLIAGAVAAGATSLEMSPAAFSRISMRQNPDGVIAVGSGGFWSLDEIVVAGRPLVVADGIEKPGNLGAILRTADACGVAAVVATNDGIDLANPNLIRSSQGSVFTVPAVQAPIEDTLSWLTDHGIRLVVGSPDAVIDLWDADLGGEVALGVGSEHRGISPALRSGAQLVRVPMVGAADSLNTSVAAAMLMYEAVRQRHVT